MLKINVTVDNDVWNALVGLVSGKKRNRVINQTNRHELSLPKREIVPSRLHEFWMKSAIFALKQISATGVNERSKERVSRTQLSEPILA